MSEQSENTILDDYYLPAPAAQSSLELSDIYTPDYLESKIIIEGLIYIFNKVSQTIKVFYKLPDSDEALHSCFLMEVTKNSLYMFSTEYKFIFESIYSGRNHA